MEEESRGSSKSHGSFRKEDRKFRHRSRSPRIRKEFEVRDQKRERRRRRSSDGDLDVPRKPRRRSSDGDLQIERHRQRSDNERGHQRRWRGREGTEAVPGDGRRWGDERSMKRPRDGDQQNSSGRFDGHSAETGESAKGQDVSNPSAAEEQNFGLSGKLAAETNTYKGVVINYSEPEEARIPKTRWRLYGFKGEETLPTFYVHRQSAYLIGRDRRVCDMPVDHPSCSKQHAVLQYRLIQYERPDGSSGKRVRPYVIDLGSTNGTYINNNRVEAARYYELKEKDMLKFGFSSREYVLLHENTKEDIEEDEQD